MKNSFLCLLFSLFIFMTFSPSLLHAQATQTTQKSTGGTTWTWIASDERYGKFYTPERVRVTTRDSNGTPTCIEAWIKTAYTPAGAAETVPAMNLTKEIPNPAVLSYSLAFIEINPQGRTLDYKEEIFYDKNGNVLVSHKYAQPRLKEINSQSFDENFYDAIVDQVFGKGETARTKANDRWITLWRQINAGMASSSTADTTTIRKRGDDVFVWIWQETRNNSTSAVTQINFYKKVFNLATYSYKLTSYSSWTAADKWQDQNATLTGQYISIVPDSKEDMEFRIIKQYVADHPDWVNRYQPVETKPAAPANTNAQSAAVPPVPASSDTL
ncbi:hypothetical protein [Pectinatus cerevisiiphilus]|uniref:Uncharacterized protein n=1 Tax=Pectinatus cerevisiiphilus TaxID=86956 RepID=A0A4R3K2T7_9FIRM|nr:hypothetical protein [Pectinatus cerevisiiphilus]TCS76756.1 hypothetical protein EDC37_1201 [Pectinatus cerevisiiphilus]